MKAADRAINWLRVTRRIARHPANRHRPLSALLRAASWRLKTAFLPGYSPVFVLPSGLKVRCRSDSSSSRDAAYYGGITSLYVDQILNTYLRPGDLVADVGANVGLTALVAGRRVAPTGTVFAFEAVPQTTRLLRQNSALNGLATTVRVLQLAVGRQAGNALITTSRDETDHILPHGDTTSHSEKSASVEMAALQDCLPRDQFALWKIDVEGYELEVLHGAEAMLSSGSVDLILLEVNGGFRRYGYEPSDLQELLVRHGYDLGYMDFATGTLTLGGHLWEDVLGIRHAALPSVAERLGATAIRSQPVFWGELSGPTH